MAKNEPRIGLSELDQWICTRRFTTKVKGKRKFATAKIERPVKSGRDWACKVMVSNVGMKEPTFAYGVDSMQALIMALEYVRTVLRHSGTKWRFVYGEKDDLGMPRFRPSLKRSR